MFYLFLFYFTVKDKRFRSKINDEHASELRLTLHLYIYIYICTVVGLSSFEDIQLILSVVGVIDGLDYERHNRYAVWSDVDV